MLENFFPKDILYHIANTVILFVILRFLVYKPVRKFMRARTERIAGALNEAEEARVEATQLKADYERRIAEVEKNARERALEITSAANESVKLMMDSAKQESLEIVEKAHTTAQTERDKAMSGLRDEVIDLAAGMAAQILQAHFEHAEDIAGGERVE